jgi:hypothetical protein
MAPNRWLAAALPLFGNLPVGMPRDASAGNLSGKRRASKKAPASGTFVHAGNRNVACDMKSSVDGAPEQFEQHHRLIVLAQLQQSGDRVRERAVHPANRADRAPTTLRLGTVHGPTLTEEEGASYLVEGSPISPD